MQNEAININLDNNYKMQGLENQFIC